MNAEMTLREIADVLGVLEAGARDGFNVPDRVRVGGRVVRIAWAYDAGLDSVREFPAKEAGDPVAVADVWLSSNDGYLKLGVWSGSQNVGGCHLDGVPVADLVAAWQRLFGVPYAGELGEVVAPRGGEDGALLEVKDCDPFNGGITDPFFPREDTTPALW